MERCTSTEMWPDKTDDVPAERLDDYLNHTQSCSYHATKLCAEDEELRAIFKTARGLNSEASFLTGSELERAVDDHQRRRSFWKSEVVKKQLPFTYLVLRNAGKEIACCGEFFQFEKHQAVHWLDIEAGLQIFGIIGPGNARDEVLLGYYPLANVRHRREKFLQLENGYVVGLRVRQFGLRTFQIHFRCIGSETIKFCDNEEHKVARPFLTSSLSATISRVQSSSRYVDAVKMLRNLLILLEAKRRLFSSSLVNGAKYFLRRSHNRPVSENARAAITPDNHFYAFVLARTSHSRAHIRRISVHKRWLKASALGLCVVAAALMYGFYGLIQQAEHLRTERENARLRLQNEKQRHELQTLNTRVNDVEDMSRKLAETKDALYQQYFSGQGGPALPVSDIATMTAIENQNREFEQTLSARQGILRSQDNGAVPWPMYGELGNGFGFRRNPFAGAGYEFHSGQDIDGEYGAPIISVAAGTVTISGRQRGYGNVVYIDHGGGLSTRYGHLSQINVAVGQKVTRGQTIGLVGSTGRSTGPHLHYEIRVDSIPVDPLRFVLAKAKQ